MIKDLDGLEPDRVQVREGGRTCARSLSGIRVLNGVVFTTKGEASAVVRGEGVDVIVCLLVVVSERQRQGVSVQVVTTRQAHLCPPFAAVFVGCGSRYSRGLVLSCRIKFHCSVCHTKGRM